MFPIGDDRIQGGPAPLVTVSLVLLNVLAFLFELSQPSSGALQSFIQAWGVVPREYALARDIPPTIPLPFWSTLITSMFLHGGWLHLGGNMLYLWIFGDNIEDRLGHVKYAVFYLLCGTIATLSHAVVNPASRMPAIGASGAIAGVLGAYLILFPRARVTTLIPIFVFITVRELPAVLVLGLWFVLQFFVGVASIGVPEESAGGVAYFAHIGGFVAGMLLVMLMGGYRRPPPTPITYQDYWR